MKRYFLIFIALILILYGCDNGSSYHASDASKSQEARVSIAISMPESALVNGQQKSVSIESNKYYSSYITGMKYRAARVGADGENVKGSTRGEWIDYTEGDIIAFASGTWYIEVGCFYNETLVFSGSRTVSISPSMDGEEVIVPVTVPEGKGNITVSFSSDYLELNYNTLCVNFKYKRLTDDELTYTSLEEQWWENWDSDTIYYYYWSDWGEYTRTLENMDTGTYVLQVTYRVGGSYGPELGSDIAVFTLPPDSTVNITLSHGGYSLPSCECGGYSCSCGNYESYYCTYYGYGTEYPDMGRCYGCTCGGCYCYDPYSPEPGNCYESYYCEYYRSHYGYGGYCSWSSSSYCSCPSSYYCNQPGCYGYGGCTYGGGGGGCGYCPQYAGPCYCTGYSGNCGQMECNAGGYCPYSGGSYCNCYQSGMCGRGNCYSYGGCTYGSQ